MVNHGDTPSSSMNTRGTCIVSKKSTLVCIVVQPNYESLDVEFAGHSFDFERIFADRLSKYTRWANIELQVGSASLFSQATLFSYVASKLLFIIALSLKLMQGFSIFLVQSELQATSAVSHSISYCWLYRFVCVVRTLHTK